MHIAGSAGTKMIALFGPTKSYEWAPSWKISFTFNLKAVILNDIKVDEVFELSDKILKTDP